MRGEIIRGVGQILEQGQGLFGLDRMVLGGAIEGKVFVKQGAVFSPSRAVRHVREKKAPAHTEITGQLGTT